MPPIEGVAGQMVISFFPPGGASTNGFASWLEMGKWYLHVTDGRRDASPSNHPTGCVTNGVSPDPARQDEGARALCAA